MLPQVLVYGQQGDLYGLATNPKFPHIFATASDSDAVMVWSADTHKVSDMLLTHVYVEQTQA